MRGRLIRVLPILMALILTAKLGTIQFEGHKETWYDLPMQKVVKSAQNIGIPCEYWVREDGVKMFGQWVIIAAHPSKIKYSRVQTSLGEGIILDVHEVDDTELIDIATDWRE
jgi:hypothetical protein